jgi:hypothetical protein
MGILAMLLGGIFTIRAYNRLDRELDYIFEDAERRRARRKKKRNTWHKVEPKLTGESISIVTGVQTAARTGRLCAHPYDHDIYIIKNDTP